MGKFGLGFNVRVKINGKWHDMGEPEIESNLSNKTKENIMNYEDEAKKRRTCPVFSNTYDNGGWSERDALPTGDPIGDVDEKHKKDQENYDNMMASKLLNPEGKKTYDGKTLNFTAEGFPRKKCNCGTQAVYGKVPLDAHRHYCDLRN